MLLFKRRRSSSDNNEMTTFMPTTKFFDIPNSQHGFTLVEMMIVVTIIGILTAIVYPNYKQYVIKTKRADMMSEMHNIASEIESRKLAQGAYNNALVTGLGGNFPKSNPLYEVTFTDPLTSQWIITAEPIGNKQMDDDGDLSLSAQGVKCRIINSVRNCGTNDEWND